MYNIKFVYSNKTKRTLLETLEHYNIPIHYQCRSGYCGSCTAMLIQGCIKYYQEPIVNQNYPGEIFTCCCYPVTHIILKNKI